MNIYSSLFQQKGLSLERLKSFCLVAEKGGFNKAAGENIYKQSQFSRQIAHLEKFFASTLFIRSGKTIKLSPRGQELYAICKDFFANLHSLKNTARSRKEPLIISAGQSIIDFLLPQAFNHDLMEELQNVTFLSRSSDQALEDVLNYQSHCAFLSRLTHDKNITSMKILSSPIVMIYSSSQEKRFYVGNDIKKIAQNPIAMIQGQGELRASISKLFGRNKPHIVFEAPTFLALKRLAATGKVMAFVPQYTLLKEDKDILVAKHLPDKLSLNRSIYLIWRKNITNQNKPLLQTIRLLADSLQTI